MMAFPVVKLVKTFCGNVLCYNVPRQLKLKIPNGKIMAGQSLYALPKQQTIQGIIPFIKHSVTKFLSCLCNIVIDNV